MSINETKIFVSDLLKRIFNPKLEIYADVWGEYNEDSTEDSIMYMQSQIEIGKLNKNIKDIRKENEKMRNNINGADIDASYDILTNNLKKRQR